MGERIGGAGRRAADVRLGRVSFAGYSQTGGAVLTGGFLRAVLRTAAGVVMWTCEHTHVSRHGAMTCATQAEGLARTAGLLPDATPLAWGADEKERAL